MKTLIVYDSKHGATEKVSSWIKEGIGDADICNVNNVSSLNYDLILVGSPIYFGKPLKSVISFLDDKRDELKNKRIIPFVVCIRNGKKYLSKLKNFIPNTEDGKIFRGRFLFHKLNKEECINFGRMMK